MRGAHGPAQSKAPRMQGGAEVTGAGRSVSRTMRQLACRMPRWATSLRPRIPGIFRDWPCSASRPRRSPRRQPLRPSQPSRRGSPTLRISLGRLAQPPRLPRCLRLHCGRRCGRCRAKALGQCSLRISAPWANQVRSCRPRQCPWSSRRWAHQPSDPPQAARSWHRRRRHFHRCSCRCNRNPSRALSRWTLRRRRPGERSLRCRVRALWARQAMPLSILEGPLVLGSQARYRQEAPPRPQQLLLPF